MHFLANKLLPHQFSEAVSTMQDKQMLVPGHACITPNRTKPTTTSRCGQSTERSFSSLQHKICVCGFLLSANSSMQYETENMQSFHNLDHTNGALIKGLLERVIRLQDHDRSKGLIGHNIKVLVNVLQHRCMVHWALSLVAHYDICTCG